MLLQTISALFFTNNKINNSHFNLKKNYIFKIRNRKNIYDEESYDPINNNIHITKYKQDKNIIYEKTQKNNKNYINNYLQNNLNQYYNENIKENINKNKILNYSNNYQIQHKVFDNLFNNKMKIKKNNKIVYINSLIFMRKKNKNKRHLFLNRKRSSKYRGVSRNGNHWQTSIMNNRNYSYIGTYNSEELAARIYDLISIKKKGIKAKTNFIYNNIQIQNILLKEINFKDKDINNEKINFWINDI